MGAHMIGMAVGPLVVVADPRLRSHVVDQGHEIGDDKRVKLKEGDRYTAISGQDVS